MKNQTQPAPKAAHTIVVTDGKRDIRLFTDNEEAALHCCRVAYPQSNWQISERIESPDPNNAVIDATKINLSGEVVDEIKRTKALRPPTIVDATLQSGMMKIIPIGAGSKPQIAPAKPAKIQPVPFSDFNYQSVFPKPRKLKLPKGVEWPGEPDADGTVMEGDKIVWQMLAAGKYSSAQIITTVLHHEHEVYKTADVVEATIELVGGWMKALGYKGKVVK